MKTILVLENPNTWPLLIPGVDVVSARDYLTASRWSAQTGARVYNLCRSYRYQSVGYYVSLLAEARGHRPLPSLTAIQDTKSQSLIRIVSDEIEELIQKSLSPLKSPRFTLSVYFGRNVAQTYSRLGSALFNLFQAPLLRAQFVRRDDGHWEVRSVGAIAASEVPEEHWPFVMEVAHGYFQTRRPAPARRSRSRFDFAILHNPDEAEPPSDAKALQKFIKAGDALECSVELITPDEYERVPEFDALFIRETTNVHHHTYRFSRRAEAEGLVVIDDPKSILRCCNKVYLAEALERQKVPVPKTLIVHRDNFDEIVPVVSLPCVLKRPDSSFSRGVEKVHNVHELKATVADMLSGSDLVIAQEFLPTDFDWRVGIFDRQPLYACRYYMAAAHWQIVKTGTRDGQRHWGRVETVPLDQVPKPVLRAALAAANAIGDGLYGVDLKQSGKRVVVIEVNDNPNIEAGAEDAVLKDDLYLTIMRGFLRRVETSKSCRVLA